MALLCLVGWSNALADTTTLNQSSNKSFTTNPAESAVTFSITNLGDWGSNKGYQVAANNNAVITWSGIPSGSNIKITTIEVKACCDNGSWFATKSFDVYTSVSGSGTKKSESGNSTKTITLNEDTYLKNIGASGSITIAHGDTKMYVNSVVITYTIEAEPFIEIEDANITNQWNCNLAANEYKCAAYNTTGFSVGASSDAEVASYDAVNNVFVLGHKTGTAYFTVSADGVEDRTFTITANQGFYGYAANIVGEAALAGTHNKSDAEAAMSTFRANKIASAANGDDVTYMLDNVDFQYGDDWDYGWTGTNDENHTGNGSGGGNNSGDPMNGYQKYIEGENVYPRMYRGNWGVYNFKLASGNVYQNVQLVSGYYRLSADAKCNSNDKNVDLTGTLYAKDADEVIGKFDKKCAQNSGFANITARFAIASAKEITVGYSHNELGGSAQKEVAVDNFSLTYICSKEIYDAYMEQYNRADGLKDDANLQAATKEAITAAFVDINTLADATAIEAQTATLKAACDAAEADIAWVENNAATVNINNVYVYADTNKVLSRGADWGTRAIITENGIEVNITTDDNGIANFTFTDTDKKLFETTDNYIFTDFNNNGNYDFYLVGDDENGYKIVLAGDRTKALGILENQDWNANGNSGTADVIMPVDLADATVWHFAADKSKLSVKANRYGTFCAPYNVTLPDNVIAYSAAIDGTAVILTELQDKNVVPANTPVIIKNDNNEDVTAYYYGEAATSNTVTAGPLVGVFVDMPVPVGAYVMQIQNYIQNFYIVVEGKQPNITKNKAYIQTDSQARQLTLVTNEETAIDAIEALLNNKTEIYDLNGRRMNSLQKGINIVNGKKIIVK